MATLNLDAVASGTKGFVDWAGQRSVAWPIAGAAVAAGWALARHGGALSGLAPSEAVVVIGGLGGLFGLAAQTVGSQLLEDLNRDVNVLEVAIPAAVATGVGAASLYALLPPNNQAIYRALTTANLA